MALLKIDRIISFSSEDSFHQASNILSLDSNKKWKCCSAGEKNAIIVLQLENASVITGIDIGNEHSAYVEILVSRSENNGEYKVLLTMHSFMTPVESRQSQNVNKVRMFDINSLSKPECNEKWDRIKIVCTQPFNKHVQYGLSFINFHSSGYKEQTCIKNNIGKFAVRAQSPDNLSLGSIFSKQKDEKQEYKLTGAAAMREASSVASLAAHGSPIYKPKLKIQNSAIPKKENNSRQSLIRKNGSEDVDRSPKPRNKQELFYSKEELDYSKESNNLKTEKNDSLTKKNSADISKNQSKTEIQKRKNTGSSRENIGLKKIKLDKPRKPFQRLLENVTLVISGIANPDRGNLRTMATTMGAKYKPDWDNSCTHLICAFVNTPKYNQVKGNGKIVKRDWIEECFSQRKKLPWRRFALDKNEQKQVESEDEILEEVINNNMNTNTEADDYTDHIEDASDTEERLLEASSASYSKAGPSTQRDFEDVYSADTDIEDDLSENIPVSSETVLENFFEGKIFYIDKDFEKDVFMKLNRYIVGYKGRIITEPSLQPDMIISSPENSLQFKTSYPAVDCVSPSWIWLCHNKQKYVKFDKHLL